ncbi:5-formyltetrahydrofolate cyclo-ligase [Streptomyces sp. NPDC002668]|uniref:5-formyltetrahydrofolate cyclo-ligase n=1 Tax=Streptomyces sp. NPDC002668 TaxID=3154422 RepID=UPI00332BA83A
MSIDDDKQAIRDKVWRLLEQEHAAPSGSYGKIPSFEGADRTAALLAELDIWQRAQTVKANPDHAQLPVRIRALNDGKLLYMAVPKMASTQPFYLLDPASLEVSAEEAADKSGAAKKARRVGASEMRAIDVVICGSVAVNRSGTRIGKGAGYSDLEVALLIEAGLVTNNTVIVAPVHQLQVIDDEIPQFCRRPRQQRRRQGRSLWLAGRLTRHRLSSRGVPGQTRPTMCQRLSAKCSMLSALSTALPGFDLASCFPSSRP